MTHTLSISYPVLPARPGLVISQVADLFGLSGTEPPHTVVQDLRLDLEPGELVLLTGPSGSGKSSILRALGQSLGALDGARLDLPDVPLIEALPGSLDQRLTRLASCGLSEARLLFRTPAELSEGERARFRLACALASGAPYVMLDEFAAVLDRTLARVVAYNLRKQITGSGPGVICATTHEDLTDDLNPDVWIRCRGDGEVTVERHPKKKSGSASTTTFGSRMAPDATGRTSLGGITGVITSA